MVKAIVVVSLVFWIGAAPAPAADKLPAGTQLNACGCYQDEGGGCRCVKKGKCTCPGECEPVGCEAKRAKEMDKQAAAELKRIADQEKKKAAAAKKNGKKKKDEAEK